MHKVCILAAGKGSRVAHCRHINKALLPVDYKSCLSHIIEKFPDDVEIIIAVGYQASQVKDFVSIAHPQRNIKFVDVTNWNGPGSGPGASLYACKDQLQSPFIFTSCDTLVMENVPEPSENWIGIAPVDEPDSFCLAQFGDDSVIQFHDKKALGQLRKELGDGAVKVLETAFIGMAAVKDYHEFWNALEVGKDNLIAGEVQVSNGLNALIDLGITGKAFTWYDTGTDGNYNNTVACLSSGKVLQKTEEFIYFENNQTIKYFESKSRAEQRVYRQRKLQGLVPELAFSNEHFYSYHFVPGKTLPQVYDAGVFRSMLRKYHSSLWAPIALSEQQRESFLQSCKQFYKDKTEQRVAMTLEKLEMQDEPHIVNGVEVPKVAELLGELDWDWLSAGQPALFHGDFQPENIIFNKDYQPVLIDWRENFGGLLDYGDLYYDFGKLEHALIISGEIVRANLFSAEKTTEGIHLQYKVKSNLIEYREIFHQFLSDNGYDVRKVKILGILMFLNIAPLHHHPYDEFLLYLGKSLLNDLLRGKNE